MKKALPVGVDDFRKIIQNNYYFVDKSLLIKELLDANSEVVLFPRPRRFGKTLNLSMLRHFFERTDEDTSVLFQDLNIWQQGERYRAEQGKYPVISLTFKDVKAQTWHDCWIKLRDLITNEYLRHQDDLFPILKPKEQEVYQAIIDQTAEQATYEQSLLRLSAHLHRHTGQQVVILLDEYDMPIQAGYLHGYYEQIIAFSRGFLSGGLKSNPHLARGVVTGILRVAKESIFSGLNNIRVCSLLTPAFSTHFGLLEEEVEQLLRDYAVEIDQAEVKHWYNGYVFGDHVIYNPWSLISFVEEGILGKYWTNTSTNDLIYQLVTTGPTEIKRELEQLLSGRSIHKAIPEVLEFGQVERDAEAIWHLLLFSGYLKAISVQPGKRLTVELAIPNLEVEAMFEDIVRHWFRTGVEQNDVNAMLHALVSGDSETFAEYFQEFILQTFSMFDTGGKQSERVYHAFTLGLLVHLQGRYTVKSNRESGFGRYDVMLLPQDQNDNGIIIEFKKTRRKETLEQAVTAAVQQINARDYAAELRQHGCKNVVKLGIAFQGKEVLVQEG